MIVCVERPWGPEPKNILALHGPRTSFLDGSRLILILVTAGDVVLLKAGYIAFGEDVAGNVVVVCVHLLIIRSEYILIYAGVYIHKRVCLYPSLCVCVCV